MKSHDTTNGLGKAQLSDKQPCAAYTCQYCGEEMAFNVPRLGPDGGFVHKRTGKLVCKDQREHEEANAFAMELLMPEDFIQKYLKEHGPIDLANDKAVSLFARHFQVPVAIAASRLREILEEKR